MPEDPVLRTLDEMTLDESFSPDFVRFQRHVLVAQRRAQALAEELYPPPEREPNFPIDRSLVLVDPRALGVLLEELEGAPQSASAKNPEMRELLAGLRESPRLGEELVQASVGRVDMLELKRLASELEVSAFGVLLVGRLVAKPFLLAALSHLAPGFEPPPLDEQTPGRCPRCDSPAAFALLTGKEGRRQLVCGACDLRWPFHRLRCPTCQNADGEKQGLVSLGEDKTRRLEVCEVCRRYVKTLDQRELPQGFPVHPAIEA
ncbi:MAG: formate dehydrogenase accessory protein FdhE, partial [Polyangia bacterium]|nr:formate dehydrogenase accessory protein FdhE [Polyangia bacterium]